MVYFVQVSNLCLKENKLKINKTLGGNSKEQWKFHTSIIYELDNQTEADYRYVFEQLQ